MELPSSVENLTKLLRARDTTTNQIYNIVSKFDNLKLYFPNKEIFVLDLIQDRWNDQKRIDFKKDYKIWELFNQMWIKIDNDTILKKMFKNLKFIPLLTQSLQLFINSEDCNKFLSQLLKTITLVNSTSTIEISFENSCKILADILNLMSSVHINDGKQNDNILTSKDREALIMEIITLTNLQNVTEINHKLSNTYCNDLLLATINYLSKSDPQRELDSSSILVEYLNRFVFSENVDPILIFERFYKKHSDKIESDIAIMLFQISIASLSKNNFKQLQTIFTLTVNCQPNVTSTLLKELSASKKTLSQDFLENLFNTTLANGSRNIASYSDSDFWLLISHILDLDIEIGIKYTELLMDLILTYRKEYPDFVTMIWPKIIACHVNARELPQFLNKWKDYCIRFLKKTNQDACPFLTENNLTNEISNSLNSLSITQLKQILGDMVDIIASENVEDDKITLSSLNICLHGLHKISYTSLVEIKPIFSRVFETDSDTNTNLWKTKYLIMDIYDDIIPLEQIQDISEETFEKMAKETSISNELFYYFFKLREYKDFSFDTIQLKCIDHLNNISNDIDRSSFLLNILSNWLSIINITFSKENIKKLIAILLTDNQIGNLDILFEDDDFFEEENIMFNLISALAENYDSETMIKYLCQIPIQCINKNIRITLINNVTGKKQLGSNDTMLLNQLLRNPTFKTNIESNFIALKEFLTNHPNQLTIFDTIWKNHTLQSKESTSEQFIRGAITTISENLDKAAFEDVFYQLSASVITLSPPDLSDNLRNIFLKTCLDKIPDLDYQKSELLPWLLTSLYEINKIVPYGVDELDSIKGAISNLMQILHTKFYEIKTDLLNSMFQLYSVTYTDKLEYLYAQYMVCRMAGASKAILLEATESVIKRSLKNNENPIYFNEGLIMTISSLSESTSSEFYKSILELYQLQIFNIDKDNSVGTHLFVKSISVLSGNLVNFREIRSSIISLLECIQQLEISRPWLFTQYCVENLFPFCLRVNDLFLVDSCPNDEIFTNTSKLLANILLIHRVKLSNRHHLVISVLCQLLEYVSKNQQYGLSAVSAKSLARLIINFCEPANISNSQINHKHKLSSKVSLIKQSLRKHASMLVVKYVHLSINCPFDPLIRKELTPAFYSMLDLLSQNEMTLVSSILDTAGKQYFRSLYLDYKKIGKWRED